jgi:hypothetical protein
MEMVASMAALARDGQRSDSPLISLSLVCFLACLACYAIAPAFDVPPNYPMCGILAIYCVLHLMYRGSLSDPVLVFAFTMLIYAYLPLTIDLSFSQLLARFGYNGANLIYAAVIPSFFAGNVIAMLWMPLQKHREQVATADTQRREAAFTRAAILGSATSIALSLIYIARNGVVLGGDVAYSEGFVDRMAAGAGVLQMAVPTAIAALAFALMSRKRFSSIAMWLPIAAFFMLLISQGQRKYLIIPALMLVAGRVRFGNPLTVVAFGMAGVIAYIGFNYLGYMRTYGIDLSQALDQSVLDRFFYYLPANVSGETPALYATTSSAYTGFIVPLPNFGDYLLSWAMLLPQFFFGQITYQPATTRFSYALDPVAASQGMGYGYSLWGEAYLVGGFLAITVVALISIIVLRFIYVRAGGSRLIGMAGVIALSTLYYALWLQRNPIAYFMREYVLFQLVPTFALYWIALRVKFRIGKQPASERASVNLRVPDNDISSPAVR